MNWSSFYANENENLISLCWYLVVILKKRAKEDAFSLFRKICSHLDLAVGLFLDDREHLLGRLCTWWLLALTPWVACAQVLYLCVHYRWFLLLSRGYEHISELNSASESLRDRWTTAVWRGWGVVAIDPLRSLLDALKGFHTRAYVQLRNVVYPLRRAYFALRLPTPRDATGYVRWAQPFFNMFSTHASFTQVYATLRYCTPCLRNSTFSRTVT